MLEWFDSPFEMMEVLSTPLCFDVNDVWVLPACDRVLYSQQVMKALGITHRLDEGYILLPGGGRKTIHAPSYPIELAFARPAVMSARSLRIPRCPTMLHVKVWEQTLERVCLSSCCGIDWAFQAAIYGCTWPT